MRKIFLDANVIVDFLDESAEGHSTAKDVVAIVRNFFNQPYTTCTSFAIVYFLIGKKIKPTARFNSIIKEIFEGFNVVTEDQNILKKAFNSSFKDLEDGLQYFAACNAGIDIFITKNTFDFVDTDIPVLHPFEFVNYYDNI